jgi:hypothetical protein
MKLYTIVLCAILSGCAGTSAFLNDHEVLAQAGVQYATAKFVRSAGDVDQQASRKARIRAVAGEVRTLAAGQSATITLLQAAVMAKLPADMLPEDRVLVNLLIAAVVQELQKRVGDGVLDPDQQLLVAKVLDWVEQGTALI